MQVGRPERPLSASTTTRQPNILTTISANTPRDIPRDPINGKFISKHVAAGNSRDNGASNLTESDPFAWEPDCDPFLLTQEPSRVEQTSESTGDPFEMDDALMLDALASSMADNMMVDIGGITNLIGVGVEEQDIADISDKEED